MQKKHSNRLINETSPYLLQHAHNPVDWHPWGDEAFERARAEDKPVLVSIGYSACHWCHVMEHESFESEEIARQMNEHFINIKVDMEERPDVDQIYMTFVQMTTGRGGWPMNVFITPDKLPFFGGTYFPPAPRHGMPSWPQILDSIAEAWRERRDELMHSANEILGELRRVSLTEIGGSALSDETLDTAFQSFVRSFDAVNGGWGGAPKFPSAMGMEFLLRYWKRTGNENALKMVEFTAQKMADGGIYDQLGGGFHRYSVDAVWLVPHFEKMLYDNAQLARIYLHLYQITKNEAYKTNASEILDYVRREMTGPEGGFYSTQDADSEGEEGKFFVWTPAEVESLLGEEDGSIFSFYYDISDDGNFEGTNIPNKRFTIAETASAMRTTEERVAEVITIGREKLFAEREKRIKPFRDEKVITAWNGLMLAAFAEAAAIFNNDEYLDTARANADFALSELLNDGRVIRTWKDGRGKLNGYIEDHANLADGLIELFKVTGDVKYFDAARTLADNMITEFWDEESGGFFFTSKDHEELIVRNKDFYDNATPSGNSVAADVLSKLAKLTGEENYWAFASATLRIAVGQVRRHPQGFGRALGALAFHLGPTREVVILAERGSEMEREFWSEYRPYDLIVRTDDPASASVSVLRGRDLIDGKPTAFVCEEMVCQRPVATVDELRAQLN